MVALSGPLVVAALDHTAALGGAELALARLLDRVGDDVTTRTILFADGPLVERLVAAGHEVEVLALSPDLASAHRHEAGGSALAALTKAARTIPFAVRLGRRLRALRPDVIYTTSLKADLIGIPAAWIAQRPLVWHIHDRISPDYLPSLLVRVIRFLARRVPHQVIVNSAATAATLPGVRNLTIAYPGFSADQVGPSPAARATPASPTVGILGRISPTKGQLTYVRAAAQVLAIRPDVRFRIIGAPLFSEQDYADEVSREVHCLGIGERIEFAGFASDPAAALDALTLCVHASGTPEPFGQVIVEAMIRGVPVIATRGGGVTEIVQPDPNGEPLGWLVPPNDVEALADAILASLEHPDEARRRAEAAWSSATERFPIEATVTAVSRVWHSAATPRR